MEVMLRKSHSQDLENLHQRDFQDFNLQDFFGSNFIKIVFLSVFFCDLFQIKHTDFFFILACFFSKNWYNFDIDQIKERLW